jgi:hypothetical protein
MQSVQVSTRHKLLGVPFAPAVQTLFPEAKSLVSGGVPYLLVPHQPAETYMLRKLGFDAPSPILCHYDWAGGTPFSVQKKTCAMLTAAARAYVLNGMGCVDSETEYLSPTGWKRIADYTGGEVAQYLPTTKSIEFVAPQQFVKLPCVEMIRFKTTRGVDQLLSPEHRVLLADGRVVSAEYIEAKYGSRASRDFKFLTTFKVVGTVGLAMSDAEIRLQVAVNADAHEHASWGKVAVRLKKPRKIGRMRALLTAAGVRFTEKPCAPAGFTRFTFAAPATKGFDDSWWTASQAQLEVVADEATYWDGSFRKASGWSFSSYTKADADFIQYAYSAAGRRASLTHRARRGGKTDHCVYAKEIKPEVSLYGVNGGIVANNVYREPSTDGFKYCFVVPSTFLLLRRNGSIFATGNTGKTKAALWAWDFLRKNNLAGKLLVLAPLSTLTFTWQREIFNTLPHRKCAVLHGDKTRRLQRLADPDAEIYILNHDGIEVIFDELVSRTDIDTLVIDELAVFRNGGTNRTKTLRKLTARMLWAWGMSGAPVPNKPTDAWAQASILTPHTVPKYFNRFRDELMTKVSNFTYVPKHDAVDRAFAALQPAVRYTLDDVMELPEAVGLSPMNIVTVDMGPNQAKVYRAIADQCFAAVQSQEITAANAGAVMSKLLQISAGWVYTKEGATVALDNGERIQALMDGIEATDNKVLVFVPFKHALAGIGEALKKAKISHALVSGDTPAGKRAEVFNIFQNTNKFHVIAAHPQCLAHGITLTAADTVIWFSPTTSLEIYDQANHRIRRIGQKHKQLYLHLCSTPVEKKIYKLLEGKQRVQERLLELFEAASE